MAGPSNGAPEAQFACKCLNIRILPASPHSSNPDMPRDPDFTQVFVGKEGITIAHPPITVRTRTRGVPVTGSSRFSRYTTVTCLLCNLLVYRVYQIYSADVEGKDGPVLPTENWVERDVLKSLSGWIDVHRDCLTNDAIEQAQSSESSYSSSFGLVLPSLSSPSTGLDLAVERPPSRSSMSSPPPPPKFFPNIPPVFLPPPYTPSHPVFEYLASLAENESQIIRDSAEVFMTEQMRLKSSEIQRADDLLRRRVNALWKVFKDNLGHIQPEKVSPRRPSSRSRERFATNDYHRLPTVTPNAIRDFNPAREIRGRSFSPPAPRVSALSQSLATSSFHHPRPRATTTSPPPARDRSPSHESSHSDSYTIGSSTIVAPHSVDGTNILKIRRNVSEAIDTATSYRYFQTLEEDMARLRGGRASDQNRPISDQIQPDNSSQATDTKNANNDMAAKRPSGSRTITEKSPAKVEGQPYEEPVSPSRGREKSKGSRKVTFNVNPAVVTIKREVNAEKEEEEALAYREDRDLIFDLEDLEAEDSGSPGNSQSARLLVEQPSAPVRPRKHRPRDVDGLATAFAGLRPASLPAPSHIRPPRSPHGSDLSSPSMVLSLPRPIPSPKADSHPSSASAGPSSLRPQETRNGRIEPREMQSLAADDLVSSGQESSNRVSRATARRHTTQESTIMEEGEEEDGETDASGFAVPQLVPRRVMRESSGMLVGSLAIPIKQGKQKETLSLASYQPNILAAQTQAVPISSTSHKQQSSTAIRKSMYAERDRSRSLDPGPLDFQADEDDEAEQHEEYIEEGETQVDTSSAGGRGRKAALKILKVRSEVPEAGMWRSLAS